MAKACSTLRANIGGYEYHGVADWFATGVRHGAVNYTIFIIEVVSNAINRLQPRRVLIVNYQCSYRGWLLRKDEHYHDKVVAEVCNKYEVKPVVVGEILLNNKEVMHNYSNKVKEPNSNWLFSTISKLRGGTDRTHRQDNVILVSTLGYNLKNVVRNILRWHPSTRIIVFSETRPGYLDRLKNRFWGADDTVWLERYRNVIDDGQEVMKITNYETINELKAQMEFGRINYTEIVPKKITLGIVPRTVELATKATPLLNLIQHYEPKLVLSIASRGVSYLLGEVCWNMGIQGMCISHGSVTSVNDEWAKLYNYSIAKAVILNRYPTIALQTREAEEFFLVNKTKSRMIQTGSRALKKIRRRSSRRVRILHAVTLKSRSSIKVFGVETVDEFRESVKDVIDAIQKYGNYELSIKLHPASAEVMATSDWQEYFELPQNAVISRKSIEGEMRSADILISYSSTVIEEALINRIPVILSDKWKRYRHLDAFSVDSDCDLKSYPVYYMDNLSVLSQCLSEVIRMSKSGEICQWNNYCYGNEQNETFKKYVGESLLTNVA